ncbi:carbohydrate kinase family protein [Roseovarius sp.]|uniref:carbohydrate kinase family protein n=1 Tax=Roseovarius sp. TaxID=1486281 RepID=UPI003565E7AB
MSPPQRKPATIADVADLADVAKSSVSNYLNGQVRVADATAARIAMAITKLNYRPAAAARSLTSRRYSAFDVDRLPAGLPCLTAVGPVSVDTIAEVAVLPTRGENRVAPRIIRTLGGTAANVAVLAAGLGGDFGVAASLLTSLGDDLDSDWIKAELASRHVAVISPVAERGRRASQNVVLVSPGGARTIISEPADPALIDFDDFLSRTTAPADRRWCLLFQGQQVPRALERIADIRKAGFLPAMHVEDLPAQFLEEMLGPILDAFAFVVIGRATLGEGSVVPFIDRLAGEARMRPQWPDAVLVCAGPQELVAVEADGAVRRVPMEDVTPLDEGGIDDAIAATFLAAWLNDQPLTGAMSMAASAATLVAGSLGTQEVRPSARELGACE